MVARPSDFGRDAFDPAPLACLVAQRWAGDDGEVPDSDVDRYLEAVVEAAREVLGTEFVGAYAAGSLALDAFQPGRSDIDIVLLCRNPLSEAVKRELIARLRHSALPCPARGLELVVYTVATAQSGTGKPGFELELNDGPGMAFRQTLRPADRPTADGTFWYGLDRSILHQSGRVLAGPPASEAFAELPPEELQSLLVDSLHWWMALPSQADDRPAAGADDAVLGACRALVRSRYGRWLSKVDAGRRLLGVGYEPAETIEQSIAARSGEPPPSGRQARTFQEGVLHELLAATQRPT
ncbi:nucleotidyltransferase domain-containing protein [Rhodococcus sp. (in: high G+C Gram-positive bacteria)]|uniref:nucleotidyltransferase domain-containing protein n=1 Tax=Rhodococcus sp. TaxID=1831 RepID=UPI003B8A621A